MRREERGEAIGDIQADFGVEIQVDGLAIVLNLVLSDQFFIHVCDKS
jgi:hypothetical protein